MPISKQALEIAVPWHRFKIALAVGLAAGL
jgi:hypothetical protein